MLQFYLMLFTSFHFCPLLSQLLHTATMQPYIFLLCFISAASMQPSTSHSPQALLSTNGKLNTNWYQSVSLGFHLVLLTFWYNSIYFNFILRLLKYINNTVRELLRSAYRWLTTLKSYRLQSPLYPIRPSRRIYAPIPMCSCYLTSFQCYDRHK